MAIGFSDSYEKPLKLAIDLQKALNKYNRKKLKKYRINVRIGLHTGAVYQVKDLRGRKNFWGRGIVIARRIMDLGEAKHILASAAIAQELRALNDEYARMIKPIGNYSIKHGEQILIFTIHDGKVGNRKAPKERKVQKTILRKVEQRIKTTTRFVNAKLELKITNLPNMMTHHILSRKFMNVSSKPIETHFVYIFGDTQKTFEDLHLSMKDESGKDLNILGINLDRPHRKEFTIKLNKPLYPFTDESRICKIEWDWEEPERYFEYRFATECDNFEFSLIYPRDADFNLRVYEVNIETREKILSKIQLGPKEIIGEVCKVAWSVPYVTPNKLFRFEW